MEIVGMNVIAIENMEVVGDATAQKRFRTSNTG